MRGTLSSSFSDKVINSYLAFVPARHLPAMLCNARQAGRLRLQARRARQSKIHVIMPGYVFLVMGFREQSIDITKIGISDNL